MSAEAPDPELPITPGTVLAGKYRVTRILGKGGMGVVVEARHIALEERVALKFLLPEYATHPEASGRFLREAKAAVKIKSEHVARVTDVGTLEHGEPYMVMEYLEGQDLSNILENKGPMSLVDAVDYVIQGCEAIAEAHSYGIVHRDIKPANMFLTKKADGSPLVKVLDFGISKVMGNVDALTRTTAAMGSALYMSPEQMQQTRSVDHRTDIYALGVALFELLAGKQPYYAETLPQLCAEILTGTPTPLRQARPDLPEHFAAVLEKAYARERDKRYQSVADFVVALAPYGSSRCQAAIDLICRLAGRESARAGTAPTPNAAMSGVPLGGTVVLGREAIPSPVPPQNFAQAPVRPQSDPALKIVPDPYSGPASQNAAAAFAGASTNANFAKAPPRVDAPKSNAPVIALAVLFAAIVLGGGVGVYFLKFKGGSDANMGPAAGPAPTEVASVVTPPEQPTAPVEPKTAAPAESASAPPAATAEAPVATADPKSKGGTTGAGKNTGGGRPPAATTTDRPPPPPPPPTATTPPKPTATTDSTRSF